MGQLKGGEAGAIIHLQKDKVLGLTLCADPTADSDNPSVGLRNKDILNQFSFHSNISYHVAVTWSKGLVSQDPTHPLTITTEREAGLTWYT